jgi:spore coat polysaccharide biosynthesis predicted glycosyltransferase SpsG
VRSGAHDGIGQVMRSVVLAEELRGRGAEVAFVCDSQHGQ